MTTLGKPRVIPETDWFFREFTPDYTGDYDGSLDRGGAGRNGDGSWPPGDGRGCPRCGAIRGGGHGGGCPNQGYAYDADGTCLGRTGVWDKQ